MSKRLFWLKETVVNNCRACVVSGLAAYRLKGRYPFAPRNIIVGLSLLEWADVLAREGKTGPMYFKDQRMADASFRRELRRVLEEAANPLSLQYFRRGG